MIAKRTTGSERLRLGIIGCGRATTALHLPALQHVDRIQVHALADLDEHRLHAAADRFGVPRRFTDYRELLVDDSLDAVAVCVPPGDHVEVALAVLDAGRHLFVEKPLALRLADCDRLLERAAATDRKALVGFNFRFHRLVRAMRASVQQGRTGPVEVLRAAHTANIRQRTLLPAWRDRRDQGGGVLLEIASHHFDLWRFVLGSDVRDVSVAARSAASQDDSAAVVAHMANGTLVSSLFCERTYDDCVMELFGRAGRLRASLYQFDGLDWAPVNSFAGSLSTRLRRTLGTLRDLPRGLHILRHGGDYKLSYRNQWRHFADAVLCDAPIESTLEDGRAALQIALAAVASAELNRSLAVAEAPDLIGYAEGVELSSPGSRSGAERTLGTVLQSPSTLAG